MVRKSIALKRPFDKKREGRMTHAVEAVSNGMSLRKAAEEFDVSKSAIFRNLKGCKASVGTPTVLSAADEKMIAKLCDVAEWGFPIGRFEVKLMVKDLLDSRGVTVKCLKNNFPGDDWYDNFVKRNKMSQRAAANIKADRACIDKDTIDMFIDELERSGLKDIPTQNIFNFDETNFKNDTGKSWVIVRRGRRRVEKVNESTKQSFSLMWCGSAAGQMLPPMVVYSSKNVYENWTGGPEGTKYSNTLSGWFNSKTFRECFFDLFLPNVKELVGKIVLFGDNLGSHFCPDVVQVAKEHNIFFSMLPSNATHLLQPLDVSVFHPMKMFWRTVLAEYRRESKRKGNIPKEVFPRLLSLLWAMMEDTVANNLTEGFQTCGLFPLNREIVISKLPEVEGNSEGTENILNETLISLLKENRGISEEQKKKRGKKLPKRVEGLEPRIPGRFLKTVLDDVDDDEDPFKNLREEGEYSGGVTVVAGSHDEGVNVDKEVATDDDVNFYIDVDVDVVGESSCSKGIIELEEVCTICSKSDDDDRNIDETFELEWIECEKCSRSYHSSCLESCIGKGGDCIYCGWEE